MKTILIVLVVVVVCVVGTIAGMMIRAQSPRRLKKSFRDQAAAYAGFDAATLKAGFYPTTEEIVFGVRKEHDRLSSTLDELAARARTVGFVELDSIHDYCKALLDDALMESLRGGMQTADEIRSIMTMYAYVYDLTESLDNPALCDLIREWALDVENWTTVLMHFSPDFAALPER